LNIEALLNLSPFVWVLPCGIPLLSSIESRPSLHPPRSIPFDLRGGWEFRIRESKMFALSSLLRSPHGVVVNFSLLSFSARSLFPFSLVNTGYARIRRLKKGVVSSAQDLADYFLSARLFDFFPCPLISHLPPRR